MSNQFIGEVDNALKMITKQTQHIQSRALG
jgi:hypothetical protein